MPTATAQPSPATELFVSATTVSVAGSALFILACGTGGTMVANCCLTMLLATLLSVATLTDLRSRRIPNWATYSACLWALTANLVASPTSVGGSAENAIVPVIGPAASLAGALVCFLAMLVLYDVAGSGGGDVKLATALGAILGVTSGITVIVAAHVLAGGALVAWLMWTHGPVWTLRVFARSVGAVLLPRLIAAPDAASRRLLARPVPLAGFFALATGLTLAGIITP